MINYCFKKTKISRNKNYFYEINHVIVYKNADLREAMKNKINLTIPQPCHESWQMMAIDQNGRFCASCQKNVFDFTTSSDAAIIKAFYENKNLCGRFSISQLNRDLVLPKEKSSIWLATTSVIISFLSLGTNEAVAQEKPKTEQTDKKSIPESTKEIDPRIERAVTGVVFDEEKIPIPGVGVTIKGTSRKTQTDIDGNYTIKAKYGEVIVFSYVGAHDVVLTVSKKTFFNVMMTFSFMGEVVIVHQKKTFFGQIFHKIGNLFR